ncbi:YheC/YheD family protein [Paenibacillus yanchengensis]|uniref:YheC/YheD family protein n=1 Tax=Paenibacillus yanchengensis TaxID=2035833 RepID=A0ABW4YRC1_9BACL
MLDINRNTPEIVITGSNGKTTVKNMLASILETRWNILQTTGNKNLPLHIKSTLQQRKSKHQAILLELGMGRPGAGHRHGRYIQPDIVVFTNIGSAHIGNLGNSARSIAESKSILLQYMKKDGLVLINSDDNNSEWIDTSKHLGKVLKIGIHKSADYTATEIRDVEDGIEFTMNLDNSKVIFNIPTYGLHNVYNALFAITIAHQLGFTIPEITQGLKNFEPPIKRLNIIKLRSEILLIDDTVNANPESVKSAIDVLVRFGKNKKKVVVLGSMLELGEYTKDAHLEIGKYITEKQISDIYTYGVETSWIKEGAIASGFSADRIHYFENRDLLHEVLLNEIADNSVILVKGSASMKMSLTIDFIKSWFRCFVHLADHLEHDEVLIHPRTFERLDNIHSGLTLHFGQHMAKLRLRKDEEIPEDVLFIPRTCWNDFTIPDLPYDHYFMEDHLHLGPVIGINVLEKYYKEPNLQLLRMENYDKIKGLLFMFRASQNKSQSNTVIGKYYDPQKHVFVEGIFPYPTAMFNRVPLLPGTSKRLMHRLGNKIFNNPYSNTDKWELWNTCSKIPEIKKYLPATVKYSGMSTLFKMLDQYKWVYLKPITLAGGAGIFTIWVVDGGYRLKNEYGKEWTVDSTNKLSTLVKNQLLSKRTYIIQEGISSEFDIGKVDFRIYIQKDRTGKWKFSGLESKIGIKGSIIANSKYRQKIMPGKAVLKELYLLNDEQIATIINEMTSSGIRLLHALEPTHKLLGDAAIDLIVDKSLNIRILEPQLNYATEIKQLRTDDEREVLPYIVATPWEYAKYLAGFTPYGGESEL